MPTLCVQKVDLPYTDKDLIRFEEGIIGMPGVKRMVLVNQDDIAPFLWLVSLDGPHIGFLVLHPQACFADYAPAVPADVCRELGLAEGEHPLVLAAVTIEAEWDRSSVNLRAPFVISPTTMRGRQVILSSSPYRLDEPLPLEAAAASAEA
jgi:flagellar assembly factor FliW